MNTTWIQTIQISNYIFKSLADVCQPITEQLVLVINHSVVASIGQQPQSNQKGMGMFRCVKEKFLEISKHNCILDFKMV